jgi:VWFA-related protein
MNQIRRNIPVFSILVLFLLLNSRAFSENVTVPVQLLRNGSAVPGASKEAITLSDNGKSVSISQISEFRPPAGDDNGLTIIALDTMHSPPAPQALIRKQILKFVEQAAAHNRPVLLMTWSKEGMRIIHHHQTPSTVLAEALKRISGDVEQINGKEKPQAVTSNDNIWKAGPDQDVAAEASRLLLFAKGIDLNLNFSTVFVMRIDTVMNYMQNIANVTASFPGRKKLVWLSGDLPFEIEANGALGAIPIFTAGGGSEAAAANNGALTMNDSNDVIRGNELKHFEPRWEQTIQMLQSAAVSVYPAEIQGVSELSGGRVRSTTTFQSLASITGGIALIGKNDFTPSLIQISEEPGSYYTVTFPNESKAKNGWHKLQARSNAGSIVLPSGYFDANPPVAMQQSAAPAQASNGASIAQIADSDAVPFTAQLKPDAPAGKLILVFEVPANAIKIDEQNGNHVKLDFVAIASGKDGQVAGRGAQRIDANIPAAAMDQIRQFGVQMEVALDAPAGDYSLKAVVRDNLAGKTGAKTLSSQAK